MTKYQYARDNRLNNIEREYKIKKKYENKSHTVQELFNAYKEKICSKCVNKNSDDCDIHIKRNITVSCENYKKED